MAENIKNIRRGGRYCVAGAPNEQSCKNTTFTPGVTMHQFPANPVLRENGLNSSSDTGMIFTNQANMLHFAQHTLKIRATQGL